METSRALLLLLAISNAGAGAAAAKLNVLMIAIDDLRPIGTEFGEAEALVPTIDALAAKSTVFTNAWVQAATCGVSRSSLADPGKFLEPSCRMRVTISRYH